MVNASSFYNYFNLNILIISLKLHGMWDENFIMNYYGRCIVHDSIVKVKNYMTVT